MSASTCSLHPPGAIKYICVDEKCGCVTRELCSECVVEGHHTEHDYRPYRETIQTVQDNAIHALRYYEGCQKYLNLHLEFETAIQELRQQVKEEIDGYYNRVMKQLSIHAGPSNKEWMKKEQHERLRAFLDNSQWPNDREDEELAVQLIHFESDTMVDEAAKQTIADNQTVMRRVHKHTNEALFQIKQVLNVNYKQFTLPELYNTKLPRKVEEDDDDNQRQYNFDSSTQYVEQTQHAKPQIGVGSHQQSQQLLPESHSQQYHNHSQNRPSRLSNQNENSSSSHAKGMPQQSQPPATESRMRTNPFNPAMNPPDFSSPQQQNRTSPQRNPLQSRTNIQQPQHQPSAFEQQLDKGRSPQMPQRSASQFTPQDQLGSYQPFETEAFEGAIVRVFEGHTDYVRKVLKVSPDTFLTVSDDSTIKYWNYSKTKCIQVIRINYLQISIHFKYMYLCFFSFNQDYQGLHRSGITDIRKMKDSVFISCGKDNRLAWLDVERQLKEVREVRFQIYSLEVLQDRYILLGGNRHLFLIDNENKEFVSLSIIQPRLLKEAAHEKEILAIKYIQEQSVFATSSYDRAIRVWFFQPLKQELHHVKDLIGHRQAVRALCVGHRSNLLFSGSDDSMVILWDWQSGTQLQTFQGHSGSVYAIDLLNQQEIATGSYDKTIKIWNTVSGKCVGTVNGNQTGILSLVKFNSNALLSGCDDHTIKAWA